jgi:hypothetical protein
MRLKEKKSKQKQKHGKTSASKYKLTVGKIQYVFGKW